MLGTTSGLSNDHEVSCGNVSNGAADSLGQAMPLNVEPAYEEQFTAFLDFLGFSEISSQADDATRLSVLDLLQSLSELRGEFDLKSTVEEGNKRSLIKPAISTFSDHIVISFPVQRIRDELDSSERIAANLIMLQFNRLLTGIAAAALRIGFLVRGGATIGKLYHARGVVFGEALVDAFQIESRTAIYPRVVLSNKITSRSEWMDQPTDIAKCADGLYHFDYFKTLLFGAAVPGVSFNETVMAWFHDAVALVAKNVTELQASGKLNELAKWAWFAREFRSGLERQNPYLLKSLGISVDTISWPK
jgi:hypothetical protein